MRENRTILGLLIFLRENIEKYWGQPFPSTTTIEEDKTDKVIDCLCFYIAALYLAYEITSEEMKSVEEYIHLHRPFEEKDRKVRWWPKGELLPRIEFLDMLIQKKLEKDTSPSEELTKEVIKLFELAGYKRIDFAEEGEEPDYRMLTFERPSYRFRFVYYTNKESSVQQAMRKILELEQQIGYEMASNELRSILLKHVDDRENKIFTKRFRTFTNID